jgi:predicted nucleotidyltransferase
MDSTIKNWLRNEGVAGLPGIELYLFGSVLTSERPKDVDLVIVYDPSLVDVDKAIAIRQSLRSGIHEVAGVPADILLLSTSEVEQTNFLNRIDTERLH